MTMKKVLLGMFLLICFNIKTQAQVSIKVGASLSTVAEEKENVTKITIIIKKYTIKLDFWKEFSYFVIKYLYSVMDLVLFLSR